MREIVNELKSATYPISQNGNVIGSCFAISDGGYIITACHVVIDKLERVRDGLKIIDHRNVEHQFSVIGHEKSIDVAILRSDTFVSEKTLILGDYADVEEGDEILLCGFPFGSEYHITHRGMVSAKGIINGRDSVQVDASVNQGNSGGPCVIATEDGMKVIGIVVTKLVGANLSVFRYNHKVMNDAYKEKNDSFEKRLTKLFIVVFNVFEPILQELDRFVNVGFGEAVSINYIKEWIECNP